MRRESEKFAARPKNTASACRSQGHPGCTGGQPRINLPTVIRVTTDFPKRDKIKFASLIDVKLAP
jgi:hypothetical protein